MAFVKFSRGLISSYNNLSRKDPDTLYLVYENLNADNGLLYLGDKLISTVGNNTSLSLGQLADVAINGTLEDGMLLQYNAHTAGQVGEEGKWEAVNLSSVIPEIINNSNISFAEALSNIENPKNKDIAIIGEDAYIYNNEWVHLTDSSIINRITNLENQVGHAANISENIPATGLYKDIEDLKSNVYTKEEIISQIANLDHLHYEIVSDISDIDLSNENRDNNIYLVPKIEAENDGYDEYFVINGYLEKIGSWDVNNFLSEDDRKKLDSLTLDENDNVIIQATQVGGLQQAIQDNQLIKSVQVGTFEVTPQGELQLSSVPSIDLSGYVKKEVFNATVGDLENLTNRVSSNSSIVDEINHIKESIIWQEILGN